METLLIKIKLLFPGLIGALLAAMTGPERDKRSRFIGFVFGFCVAVYVTDFLIYFFNLHGEHYRSGIGFALGYFGMGVAEALMKALRDTDIAGILKGKFGGSQ